MLRDSPADGVYVMSASAARPVRVSGESVLGLLPGLLPSWSSGGDAVYFASDRSGRNEIWKQSLGGEAAQVTGDGGFQALESPDGRFLYYMKTPLGALFRMPSGGGEEEPSVLQTGTPQG